jgi:predicted metalloprotease
MGGGKAVGGGLGLLIVIVVALLAPRLTAGGSSGPTLGGAPAADDSSTAFSGYVLDDVQDFWRQQFTSQGKTYQKAQLVVFSNSVDTGGCGSATSATGPFYCPGDQRVYLDLGFFNELSGRFDAPGDFAQAYVIAHELGHHVQNLTGVEPKVRQLQQDAPGRENELSVKMELQADCYAGVWAHGAYSEGELESGDIDEALDAAQAVGDDRLQEQATGRVNPETWTHGSSAQRKQWFDTGYKSGDPTSCDTFEGELG